MVRKLYIRAKAFTLVEIMVVVAIIGILSTLIVISLDTTKMTARNTRRLADIKQLQLALKMYYNDNGFYPTAITAGASLSRNGINYLLRVPQNPKPYNDNTCPNQDYQYKQLEAGQRYSLSFCLADTTDDLSGGPKTATTNGILDCPTDYIAVPGSATFETNDFCVMRYEAKCAATNAQTVGLSTPLTANSTYDNNLSFPNNECKSANNKIPVSTATGFPIGNITQANAQVYCQGIGGHLMTNAEWMTIARNIEQNPLNWSSGTTVGSVYTNHGRTFCSGCSTALDGTTPGSGVDKRTHTLLNGETIWDFSGNVGEWLDETCSPRPPGTGANPYYNSGGWLDWPNALINTERPLAGPSNSAWNHNTNYMGGYNGCTTAGNVMWRGGYIAPFDATTYGGIYQINMTSNGAVNTRIGFRCVK